MGAVESQGLGLFSQGRYGAKMLLAMKPFFILSACSPSDLFPLLIDDNLL